MAYSGRYKPKNPQKYKGDVEKIYYRSSWERRIMAILDSRDDVIEWASEEIIIPYQCATDYKMHRYYIDFWLKRKMPDGSIVEELWEVKPKKYCRPPDMRGRNKKQQLVESHRWIKNASKWTAAKKFAKKHGMKFYLVTEDAIFKNKRGMRRNG